ncbi:MAG: serine hydrolase [Candidatus Baldrarchaeia archaeon]
MVLSETPDNNITTPSEMALLLEKLTQGYMLSNKSRDEAIKMLLRQQLNTRIPLLLPFDVEVTHKTGTLLLNINGKITEVVNDAGIIYTNNDKEIVLSVLLKMLMTLVKHLYLLLRLQKPFTITLQNRRLKNCLTSL